MPRVARESSPSQIKERAKPRLTYTSLGLRRERRSTARRRSRLKRRQTDTLDSLIGKINDLHVGVTASVLNDGSGSLPAHLSLTSSVTGSAAGLVINGSSLGLSFTEITQAQDAVLQVGASSTGGTLITSASNTFKTSSPA